MVRIRIDPEILSRKITLLEYPEIIEDKDEKQIECFMEKIKPVSVKEIPSKRILLIHFY